MTSPQESDLNDLCVRALIRYFNKQNGTLSILSPRLSVGDFHSLRFYWALSSWIEQLARYFIENSREIRKILIEKKISTVGEILGTVDARETLLEQERSGDPCLFISDDTCESIFSEPNLMLFWTLQEASSALLWGKQQGADDFSNILNDRLELLELALSQNLMQKLSASPLSHQRPRQSVLRQINKMQSPLYRMTSEAFLALQEIEELNESRLKALFEQTLIVNMEEWQRFELATALCAAEAISEVIKAPTELTLNLNTKNHFVRIGPFILEWQYFQQNRPEFFLDTSELLTKKLLESLKVTQNGGRADIVLLREETGELMAIFECKWSRSSQMSQGVVGDACAQLVKYARDAHPDCLENVDSILKRSCVVLAQKGEITSCFDCSGRINCIDFFDLQDNKLKNWASQMLKI